MLTLSLILGFALFPSPTYAHEAPIYSINSRAQVVQPMKRPRHEARVHEHNVETKIREPQKVRTNGYETVKTIDLTPSEVGVPLNPPYRSINLGAVELDVPAFDQNVQVQSDGSFFDYNNNGEQEIVYEPIIIRRPIYVRPTAPPPKNDCYVNDSGYTCCSGDLENTMHTAYGALKASPTFNECNIGLMVVQKAAQKRFQLSFETVVSLMPFGSLSDYEGNYTCKFERDGKYFYSYATPVQYDIEDNPSEKALSNADVTHDEKKPEEISETEKQGKVNELNKAGVSSIGAKAPEGERVVRSIEEEACIKLSGVNNRYKTFEVSIGPRDVRKEVPKNGRC